MGDERAETYLELLAEAELRRAGDQLRGLDAAAGTDAWSDPGMAPFAAAEGAQWTVVRAGRILVAAGLLDQDYPGRVAADLHAAIKVRSRLLLNWDRRRGVLHRTMFEPAGSPPLVSGPASQAMRVMPIGRTLRVASDRAPSALHLMSLVRIGTEAVITVAMRMHWHVATAGEPCTLGDGMQAFQFRLTPPLAAVPDAVEVMVTGPAAQVRATIAIRPAGGAARAQRRPGRRGRQILA